MREIKFKRVFKNRNTGEISFMEWGNIDFRGQPVFDFSSFASPGTNSHSSPIADLQYTGLKDKNGKEIYEGDAFTSMTDEISIVSFKDGGFGFESKSARLFIGFSGHNWFDDLMQDFEVVGNIYEHPQLIKI